jgi:hypothetical protein
MTLHMTSRSLPALLTVLLTFAPMALLLPIKCAAVVVAALLLLAILRERLHEHHARVADSRARTAENLLRLERATAARLDLIGEGGREAA